MRSFRTLLRSTVFTSVLIASVLGLPAAPSIRQKYSGDPDSLAVLQSIKYHALKQSHAYQYVQELSDNIGPRLTGSPGALAACNWAVQKMKKIGLQDVHLEPWRLSRGWHRGIANAELTVPFREPLNIVSYGWVGSTAKGGIEAEVIAVNSDALGDEIKQHAKNWKGKILFLTPLSLKRTNPIRVFSQLGSLLTAASKAHAVAVISSTGRPGTMLTHTGPAVFRDIYFPIPLVDIAPEHNQLLQRFFAARKPVMINIDVENTVSPSTVLSYNVVGDIPGSVHPDEYVILGAHIDSWDLATGSVDDGFGVASVLGSAEAIAAQQVRPLRTIRFVLFTGEEEGLLGSLAYVQTHRKELPNIITAFAMDWGTGLISKFPLAGHEELTSSFEHFSQIISDITEVHVDSSYLSFTDGYSFTMAGVPGIAPLLNSPTYAMVGHSAADTLDKIDRKYLAQDTAIYAAMGFWVANYPSRLGIQWTPQQAAKILTRDNQKTMLDLFGLWPHVTGKG
jgi:hypothetical protein